MNRIQDVGCSRPNCEIVVLVTFFVGSALAGAAGVLVGLAYNSVHPFIGVQMGIKGLVVMLLGGHGNVAGAMMGGLVLGVLEVLGTAYLASSYRDASAFGALMLILLLRPEGLLARRCSGGTDSMLSPLVEDILVQLGINMVLTLSL